MEARAQVRADIVLTVADDHIDVVGDTSSCTFCITD